MGNCGFTELHKGQEYIKSIYNSLLITQYTYPQIKKIFNDIQSEHNTSNINETIFTFTKPYLYNSHPINNPKFYSHEKLIDLIYSEYPSFSIYEAIIYIFSFLKPIEDTYKKTKLDFAKLLTKAKLTSTKLKEILQNYFIINLVHPTIIVNSGLEDNSKRERYEFNYLINSVYTKKNTLKYFDYIFNEWLMPESGICTEKDIFELLMVNKIQNILDFNTIRDDFYIYYETYLKGDEMKIKNRKNSENVGVKVW